MDFETLRDSAWCFTKFVGEASKDVLSFTGKTVFKGVKALANAAADAMCTSGPNSELVYHYDGQVGYGRCECRRVVGQALVDLALKRTRDSYLREILSHCARIDLSSPKGSLNYVLARNRALCEQILSGDEKVIECIKKYTEFSNFTNDAIVNAAKSVHAIFREGFDYSGFVDNVFVVSVGKDIEEFVYDSEGEHVRDANGGYLTKVVGTDYSVAVFKVTFQGGRKIKFKVCLDNGNWGDVRNQVRQYI